MQEQLAELNPQMAERVRQISAAAAAAGLGAGISNRSAYERALSVGTAADARKTTAGAAAEQVSSGAQYDYLRFRHPAAVMLSPAGACLDQMHMLGHLVGCGTLQVA